MLKRFHKLFRLTTPVSVRWPSTLKKPLFKSAVQRGLESKPIPGCVGEMAGENVAVFWLQSPSWSGLGSNVGTGFVFAARSCRSCSGGHSSLDWGLLTCRLYSEWVLSFLHPALYLSCLSATTICIEMEILISCGYKSTKFLDYHYNYCYSTQVFAFLLLFYLIIKKTKWEPEDR